MADILSPSGLALATCLFIKLAYVACGGQVAAQLAPVLLARRDGHPALDTIALFVIVYGTILLWPVPLLLALEGHDD